MASGLRVVFDVLWRKWFVMEGEGVAAKAVAGPFKSRKEAAAAIDAPVAG